MAALVLVSVASAGPAAAPAGKTDAAAAERTVGTWQAPSGLQQIPIWPGAAPDTPTGPLAPESVQHVDAPDALEGHGADGVYDVSVPTLTVFPPTAPATGAGVVVFPGGGFQMLAITLEGTEICRWLAAQGIACFLSKYRVPGSNHHWDKTCRCAVTPRVPRALQDAQRSIRLVRARATQWQVDPHKIGVMGFSAGGYLVAQTSNILAPSYRAVDAVDAQSSRPDFAMALYPGHICRDGGQFDPGLTVTAKAPPTFLVQAWDDPVDDICNSTLYARALSAAGVPAEVHLFAQGGHAFGLRPSPHAVSLWPMLAQRWLKARGIL